MKLLKMLKYSMNNREAMPLFRLKLQNKTVLYFDHYYNMNIMYTFHSPSQIQAGNPVRFPSKSTEIHQACHTHESLQ